jgi:predicted SAM-dependent methyltransferase
MKQTLNVGCGERVYAEYPSGFKCTNYDIRADLSGVNEVGDATDLSRYGNETFDYILASDILEHFPLAKTLDILKEWRRVLKKGGTIEFRVPNLEAICKQYVSGKAQHISWLLYGGQSYPENFHYICFDRHWLSDLCSQSKLAPQSYEEQGNNFILKVKRVN